MTLSKKAVISASAQGMQPLSLVVQLLVIAVLVVSPRPVLAWSEAGHVVIAEAAMQQIAEPEQRSLNALAAELVEHDEALASLQRKHDHASAVAVTAVWLDKVRNRKLKDLFLEHGAKLPPPLAPFADRSTNNWHYANRPWQRGAEPHCPRAAGGELNNVLPLLQQAFEQSTEPRAKALILAMLAHLVADAHQPLHTITRVDDSCDHDRGGNDFCVNGKSERCELNLHQVWDRGFGIFDGPSDQRAQAIVQASALGSPRIDLTGWQEENLAHAEQVYPRTPAAVFADTYQHKGRQIVLERAGLAADRLAVLLNGLVE